ncbi:LOW QUALITY PROTEIN: uncharacterized protein LOC132509151 [Lagenorhynchus albirostris]|uniref:LOW QUALITY PROTEIN: uncharacterized protein LOC132509151 n=1 Tax=Lagenorhynchus albirostris TaxID=27610 RepID=UPI0028E1B4BD|nr:LOW QUALITY PROTEIN: uncharacterized protein LOC132509151 [Lagenorhynchus albirostris]
MKSTQYYQDHQMLTYILSFLPLSDQKEASLVSRAWCCAAQNALREQPGLTFLDLSGCSELADGALLAVSRGLRRLWPLWHLSLRKLQRLTDARYSALRGLRELQSLDMAECCLVRGRESAQALGLVCGAPHPLASLSLAYCSSLKDASVLSLMPALGPSLRVLDLSSCVALTNRTVQAICTYLTHLSVPHLAWCKELRDRGLLGLGQPSEETLQGPQVWDPRGHGGRGGPWAQLPSCPSCACLWEQLKAKLRRNLGSRGFLSQPPRELGIGPPAAKGPFSLAIGPALLTLQALRDLDLTACSKLTDASLTKVLQVPQLRRLSLSLLPALTDKGLLAAARGCPSVERLVLSHCSRLSDEGWVQAAGSRPRLQHLNLSRCSQRSEQTLGSTGQACKQLRMADVAMCPGISMASVRRFQAQLPEVTCVQSRFVGEADLTLTLRGQVSNQPCGSASVTSRGLAS